MGTEVAISFSALRTQLENEKSSLFEIDENIKKIVQTSGRYTDRNNPSNEYLRGGNRLTGRNSFPDAGNNYKNDDQLGKRKHETKTVFSRLSARVNDSDGDEETPTIKRARMPSAVSRELPSRAAVLRAQGDDEQARTRNRRIFGSLLGTLQKFKQEEIVLQTKEEKKALVERKIEEQARLEKEKEQQERKTLFAEREQKKAKIKALEAKMARVQEFEKWEESQKNVSNFILTKAKPHMYWLPKVMSEKANEKLSSSRKYHEKYMVKKRQELQDELQRIEQSCLHPRGVGTKENKPDSKTNYNNSRSKRDSESSNQEIKIKEEKGKKRDKFAMDTDDKDDSEGDDRHDDENNVDNNIKPKEEKEKEVNKMDTSTEDANTTVNNDTTKDSTQLSMDISSINHSEVVTEDNSAQETNQSELITLQV